VNSLEVKTASLSVRRDGGIETIDYFDSLDLQIVTDPENGITTTTRDREGRVVLIENAAEAG